MGGFRFLHHIGRNAIVERGHRLLKVPLQWVRPMVIEGNQCSLEDNTNPTDTQMEESDGNIGGQKKLEENITDPSSSSNHNPQMDGGNRPLPISSTNVPTGAVERYSLRSQSRVLYSKIQLAKNMMDQLEEIYPCENGPLTVSESDNSEKKQNNDPIPDINTSELFDDYGSFDISRIPPRIFLQIPAARQSVREEIDGLSKQDAQGIPVGEIIDSNHSDFPRLQKVHTTVVCKIKLQQKYKSMLRLRGDQQSLIHSGYVSAPTASRDFLRWITILTVNNLDFRLGMVDISQAFLQSSYIRKNDRVIALIPPYMKFIAGANGRPCWNGMVSTSHKIVEFEDQKLRITAAGELKGARIQYGVKLYRPLYGSRDAPLRWFLTISQVLRKKVLPN